MQIKPYTMFVTVGPTNSGKSLFCRSLNQTLNGLGIRSVVVSADQIRQEMLHDPTRHKHHASMSFVSGKAFKKLWATVDAHCAWPNPTQAIFIDTTGLSEEFRKEVLAKANEHQYNVVFVLFDYPKASEYSKGVPPELLNKKLFFNHYKKLKNFYKTMKTFDKNLVQVLRVRSKDNYFENVISTLDFNFFEELHRAKLPEDKNWDIIGDVHGCYDDLVTLLHKTLGHTIETTQDGRQRIIPNASHGIVFVGDIIDKGPDSAKVLDLVANSLSPYVKFVCGNHENFNHQFFQGKIPLDSQVMSIRKDYFDFSATEDQNLKDKLTYLVNESIPFAWNTFMYVTHAPCQTKYIGKFDKYSIKQQRGQYTLDRRSKNTEEKASTYLELFNKIESSRNFPFYIFGHISLKRPYRNKNIVGIDTGCVYGNRLTAVRIIPQHKPLLFSVESTYKDKPEELPELLQKDEFVANFEDLDHKEYNRIMWCAKNQISFISGTIAPAPASKETEELESLREALLLYKQRGVESVIIQPKYMGSRCQLYLHKDRSKCYAVSRNGYVIRNIDLTALLDKWHQKHLEVLETMYDQSKGENFTILDGELLPWRALGSGLVDDQYKVISHALNSELQFLKEAGFAEQLTRLQNDMQATEFTKDVNILNKKDLYKKYGDAKARTYTSVMDFDFNIDQHIDLAKDYQKQVDLYGADAELSFAPFAVLKFFGKVFNLNNYLFDYAEGPGWGETVDSLLSRIDEVYAEFEKITENTEGWVIKPLEYTEGVPNAIKVRGKPYLRLVYGYDYTLPKKYKKLINSKNINRKLKESIKEASIGQKMLQITDISEENVKYLTLVYQMIMEEKSSVGMDPRL